ncbi:MAG: pilus (MSHA type) biogenesis protein MshL [Sulfuricellaceae bacterium]|nr:pilus (MSHA type) biogenesis protein MshL [Sulfuricellaceae bacterium]
MLAGCASSAAPKPNPTMNKIHEELAQANADMESRRQLEAAKEALLPPLKIDIPKPMAKALEPRFDLVVNNAPAREVFMGIAANSRYSMLVDPEVSGSVSVNLKDVTVLEALDALRDLYGYDYHVDGTRIVVKSLKMRTRIFRVNYLTGERKGSSDIRVTSGSVSDSSPSSGSSSSSSSQSSTPGSGTNIKSLESSRITTKSTSDFWVELTAALKAIVGEEDGRNVVVSPQSGVIVVRALPNELHNVAAFLKAAQLSVDRQVILEAKILEVQLNDSNQTGINWALLQNGAHRLSAGANTQNFTIPGGTIGTLTTTATTGTTPTGSTLASTLGAGMAAATGATASGLFGLAFQTNDFAALLSFLDTQGDVHVLSSPRIATLNNQMAVLKVGTDDFFVTGVSTTTTTGGTGSTSTPSVTLQPFFSGIVLDVTPQIDDDENIILHVHPSVSVVQEQQKNIDLGSAGSLKLPLAQSNVSETDSIVRARDNQIVAIGGLMKQSSSSGNNGVPGLDEIPGVGGLFRNSNRSTVKRELVILLKTVIVHGDQEWGEDILKTQRRIESMIPKNAVGTAEKQ